MEWCLNCHRDPENYVRPREEVFTMGYRPRRAAGDAGPKLVKEYDIRAQHRLLDVPPVTRS